MLLQSSYSSLLICLHVCIRLCNLFYPSPGYPSHNYPSYLSSSSNKQTNKQTNKKKKITYTKEPLAGQLSLYNPRTHTCVSHFSSPPCKSPVKLNLYFILVNICTPSHSPNNPTGNSTNSFIALWLMYAIHQPMSSLSHMVKLYHNTPLILYSTHPTHICNYTTEQIYHSTQLSYQKHPEKPFVR